MIDVASARRSLYRRASALLLLALAIAGVRSLMSGTSAQPQEVRSCGPRLIRWRG